MKIGIISDCSSCLEYAHFKHNIKIARTSIHFNEETLVDGIDITADAFYEKLVNTDIVPTTSAPTPGEIIKCCEEYKKAGYTDVIMFPISYGLSAYGKNLEAVKDDYVEGINFHVFDCHSACIMEGYAAHYAEILADKGYTVEEIFAETKKLCDQTKAYFVVDDLKYLVKNGRLTKVAGFVGSLIKIKPVLELGINGTIDVKEKVRTHTKAVERIKELVIEETKDKKKVIYIVQHSKRQDDAEALKDELIKTLKNAFRVETSIVTPTVGAHIGAGIISIAYIVLDGLKEKI